MPEPHSPEELARIDAAGAAHFRESMKEVNATRDAKAEAKRVKEQAALDKKEALAGLRASQGIERAHVHAKHQQELLELRLRHDTEKLELQNG